MEKIPTKTAEQKHVPSPTTPSKGEDSELTEEQKEDLAYLDLYDEDTYDDVMEIEF